MLDQQHTHRLAQLDDQGGELLSSASSSPDAGSSSIDEPASGLDEAELEDFAALIVELRETMGVLLVEHDMEFVMPLVDRLVVLDFGEVIATGTPAEVRQQPSRDRGVPRGRASDHGQRT